METQNNNKKSWAKPTVLSLDINKETYSADGKGDREVGQGDAANQTKSIPS
ncbi:hypothetical protein GVN20_26595 [Runella sp. CRIBMP]|uniref:hypothetical protein n=1 Tax=Runella sp. CRIBMP TaxID=2683261 RepID=UPI001411FDC7|nr:hypothetical protein [Runella sp. CRIBMP]NBB22954.1 hypothetical protein [Runella sp. CRIBMP]